MGGRVVDAVGPAARLAPVRDREGTDGIDRAGHGGHMLYLKRSGRFSLTTPLVLHGACPEVVYEFP